MISGYQVKQPLAFPSGQNIITTSLDSQLPPRADFYSPQNPMPTISSAYFQNSQLMDMMHQRPYSG